MCEIASVFVTEQIFPRKVGLMIWQRYLGILMLLAIPCFLGCDEPSSKTTFPSEPLTREPGTAEKESVNRDSEATSLDPSKPVVVTEPADNRPSVLVPASFTETIQAIDLRDLHFPSFAEMPGRQAGRNLGFVRMPMDKVEDVVLAQMQQLGCVLETNTVVDGIRTIEFSKGDYYITAMVSKQPQDGRPSKVTCAIFNNGNIDSQTLPVPEHCKPGLSRFGLATYTTKREADELENVIRHRLTDDGWLDCSHDDPNNNVPQTRFVRRGIHVSVSILTNDQERELIYSMSIVGAEIPAPPDAKEAHLDMVENTFRCHSSASLTEVADHYQHLFEELGWKRDKEIGHNEDDSIMMVYGRGKDATLIELKKADGHTTVLLVGLANNNPESR